MDIDLKTTADWRIYYAGDQLAGYVTQYENGFTFATIHGAGHMAPQWQRAKTYHAIFNWIKGKDL